MKLALGTAQFGMPYGISNKQGQTSIDEVRKILDLANKNNIKLIDTAAVYGKSEEVLGKCITKQQNFKIVTKIPHFNTKEITKKHFLKLKQSIKNSLIKTKQKILHGILFHNTNDIFCKNGEFLLKELNKLKKDGIIKKIGFSVYSSKQISSLINFFEFDIIQLPINILDQRLLIDKTLIKLKNLNIEIHARSVFLQGLLLMPLNTIHKFFSPIYKTLEDYQKTLLGKKVTPIQAAINFLKKIKQIDYIIIGVNNSKQLVENINAYNTEIKNIDYKTFAIFDEKMINPMNWKLQK